MPRTKPALLVLLALPLVAAGPFGKKKPTETDTVDPLLPKPPRTEVPADYKELWTEALPLATGGIPDGLASLSEQNCAACHFQAHASWEAGAHGQAADSPLWRDLAAASGSSTCDSCHLPLAEQHERLDAAVPGDPPVHNPQWMPTLAGEGVTCAACHVRDAHVVAARPGVKAPHPTRWSPQLTESSFCAGCHQMTWAGADRPFYDTYGEWQRSPQGKAGVTCQTCHMGPGAAATQLGANHAPDARLGRGLTVLVELATAEIQRGKAPVKGAVRLMNTGAGHHIPTGSPFMGLRLSTQVEIADGETVWRSPAQETDFARTLDPEPPYATTADTRIPAGEERAVPIEIPLDLETPGGEATLVVRLVRTLKGAATDEVVREQRIPLRMD